MENRILYLTTKNFIYQVLKISERLIGLGRTIHRLIQSAGQSERGRHEHSIPMGIYIVMSKTGVTTVIRLFRVN